MKKFLTKTLLFILPILILGLIAEVLIRNIPNDYLYKKEYLDKNSNEIETLILGSSHTYRGLNPEHFSSKTFNAGYISQSLNYDYNILKKYKNDFENLKTIILPISYFSLYSKLENGSESWRVKNYVIYYDIKIPTSIYNHTEIFSNNASVNWKRLYDYYYLNENNQTCSELGWGKRENKKTPQNLTKTGFEASNRHTIDDIYSHKNQIVFNENTTILNNIIAWSKERNIRIYLVTLPAYETYRQNTNETQLKTTLKTINKIVLNYDNVSYLNLFDDPTFKESDYYDADHLSASGAEKLSKLINKKINL